MTAIQCTIFKVYSKLADIEAVENSEKTALIVRLKISYQLEKRSNIQVCLIFLPETIKKRNNTKQILDTQNMTSFIGKIVTCPHCGAIGEYSAYQSVNVTLNPELRDKMDDLSLFTWVCPNCGKKYICSYPFLYHDMERGILQYLQVNMPEEKLEELGYNGMIGLFEQ